VGIVSRREDIPQDVLATAEDRYLDAVVMTKKDEPRAIVLMIARAILAERERCAKIADGIREEVLAAHQHERAHAVACVAAAIRAGSN
jgi:hypothetical protein